MATVRRFDHGEIRKSEKTPDGFLRAPAFIARTGIYLYVNDLGKVTRELRRPEQVFDPEALASFALAPVTDEHPPAGYVDATTARELQRGSIGEVVEPDGSMVRATLMITDAALVKKVLDGTAAECSCGYTCEIIDKPGEWNGQPYDTEQTKIRGNHVAIVPAGRAGPAARVKLDAGDAIALPDGEDGERARRDANEPKERPIMKTKIHGIEFEVTPEVSQAIEAERIDAQARVDAAGKCTKCGGKVADGECTKCGKEKNDALASAQARADAAEAETKRVKADADKAKTDAPKHVADALEVVDVARRAGVEVKIDASLDLGAVRREVAEKVHGIKLDGKDAAYVAASFDLARARIDDSATGVRVFEVVDPKDGEGEARTDAADATSARERMTKRNADAWKTPASK